MFTLFVIVLGLVYESFLNTVSIYGHANKACCCWPNVKKATKKISHSKSHESLAADRTWKSFLSFDGRKEVAINRVFSTGL